MNINPPTTPTIYNYDNVVDVPAVLNSEEDAFDRKLDILRQQAEAERRQEVIDKKFAQIKRQGEWLKQHPILNKMVAGDTMDTDKETESTMQLSRELRDTSFDRDELLKDALGYSQSSDSYDRVHPERSIDLKRVEVIGSAAQRSIATLDKLETQAEMPYVQEALQIGVNVTALRDRAEKGGYKQSSFGLAA